MALPPSTSHAELTLNRKSSTRATSASTAVVRSTIAARPSCHVTAPIRARAATFTPSRNAPARREARIFGTSEWLSATKTKEGRKIPSVASAAPGTPPST